MDKQFERFTQCLFALEIRSGKKLIFRSKKKGIKGLIDFIERYGKGVKDLTVFDKIVGNAAALLCVHIRSKEVYGVVGSQLAKKTLKKYKIKYRLLKTIPYILNKKKTNICPMEKMSLLKTPEIFLIALKTKNLY